MSQARIESEFARALRDPARPVPDWACSPRGTVDTRRFAVYRNNVHVGLVTALRASFPVTARIVGEAFFTAMARVFVDRCKPASPLLAEYGATFPDFVAGFEPARSVAYLADVAALELAWLQAYHAADATPLGVADLQAVSAAILASRFEPHPAMRLVISPHPIGSIWSAHQTSQIAPIAGRSGEAVLVTRPDIEVRLRMIAPAEHTFAKALCAGQSAEAAAIAALTVSSDFDLGRTLVGLFEAGAFVTVSIRGS